MPSHSNRVIFDIFEFASGSDAPLPTTRSIESCLSIFNFALSIDSIILSDAALIIRLSIPNSLLYVILSFGYLWLYVFSTDGISFLAWPAANNIAGNATISVTPASLSLSNPSLIIGFANSK